MKHEKILSPLFTLADFKMLRRHLLAARRAKGLKAKPDLLPDPVPVLVNRTGDEAVVGRKVVMTSRNSNWEIGESARVMASRGESKFTICFAFREGDEWRADGYTAFAEDFSLIS